MEKGGRATETVATRKSVVDRNGEGGQELVNVCQLVGKVGGWEGPVGRCCCNQVPQATLVSRRGKIV